MGQRSELVADEPLRIEQQDDEPFGLAGFRSRRPFGRTRVDHRWNAVGVEYLVPVNVTAEDRRDVARQLRTRDHLGTTPERELSGAASRTLDAVMQAQQPYICRRCLRACRREQLPEPLAHVARVGKSDECHADPAGLEHDRARSVEDVEVPVQREERVGDAPALVIAREKKDRNTVLGQVSQGGERGVGEPGGDTAPVQEVAAVEDDVHVTRARGFERGLEALEEVGSTPSARDAWPHREVVTEMRVGQEEEAHDTLGDVRDGCTVRLRHLAAAYVPRNQIQATLHHPMVLGGNLQARFGEPHAIDAAERSCR